MDAGIPQRLDEDGFPVKEAHPNVFETYNREAKIYDSAMVERWRTAMEGLLIFAGLFSAAVTAFIIESYKTLQPDPNDQMVALLAQISQQLAGTQTLNLPRIPDEPFSPPWTAVATNILWFISLGLSLACAVAATLVQQWARNYVHTIERRPDAERRARMRMYLFEGIERFGMSRIIDGIPTLIHIALFTFLLGLVFFIKGTSTPVTVISSLIFAVCVATYLTATLLPMITYDSPIQTPLTSVLWNKRFIRLLYWTCGTSIIVWHELRQILLFLDLAWTCIDLLLRSWASAFVLMARQFGSRIKVLYQNSLSVPWATISIDSIPTTDEILAPSSITASSITTGLDAHQETHQNWSSRAVEMATWDSIRASVARDDTTLSFWQREQRAFVWLVHSLEEDREILPFLESIPVFISPLSELVSPTQLTPATRQDTFSIILSQSYREILYSFPYRYSDNLRVISACVNFALSAEPKTWTQLFASGAMSIRDHPDWLWVRRPSFVLPPYCLEAELVACWSQVSYVERSGYDAVNAFLRCASTENEWSSQTKASWSHFLRLLNVPTSFSPDVNFRPHLIPYLALARLLVNVAPYVTGTNYHPLLKTTHRFSGLLWYGPSSEEQVVYCRTMQFIAHVMTSLYDQEVVAKLWPIDNSLRGLCFISDPAALRIVGEIVHHQPWTKDRKHVFHYVVDELRQSGQCFSEVVDQKFAITEIAYSSGYSLLHRMQSPRLNSDIALQTFFTSTLLELIPTFSKPELAYMWFINPENEIADLGLIIEAAIDVFYTIDDLQALTEALTITEWFLDHERFPYHQLANECREYLRKVVSEKMRREIGTQVSIRPEQGVQADL